MFQVLKLDGPTIVTNSGQVTIAASSYADGGKSKPVDTETVAQMRRLLCLGPALVNMLVKIEAEYGYLGDGDSCECGRNSNGLTENGEICEHRRVRTLLKAVRHEAAFLAWVQAARSAPPDMSQTT